MVMVNQIQLEIGKLPMGQILKSMTIANGQILTVMDTGTTYKVMIRMLVQQNGAILQVRTSQRCLVMEH